MNLSIFTCGFLMKDAKLDWDFLYVRACTWGNVIVITSAFLMVDWKGRVWQFVWRGGLRRALKLDLMTSYPPTPPTLPHTRASTNNIVWPWCSISENSKPYSLHLTPSLHWGKQINEKTYLGHSLKYFFCFTWGQFERFNYEGALL